MISSVLWTEGDSPICISGLCSVFKRQDNCPTLFKDLMVVLKEQNYLLGNKTTALVNDHTN